MKTNSMPVSYHASEADGMEFIASEPVAVQQWSDSQLIMAVRRDPPNEAALDVLVARYWNTVFARCQLLTQDRDKARDLAQATWCRLLRARQSLKPDGNFPAYLAAISTNLFRDSYRAFRRAGPMAVSRLESLEAPHANDDGEAVVLVDIVADLKSLQLQEQTLLAIDIDKALEKLTPQLREVVIARFVEGESCADIGLRHRRTEQTVSGWVREAVRQLKFHLEGTDPGPDYGDKNWKAKQTAVGVSSGATRSSFQEYPAETDKFTVLSTRHGFLA